MNLRARFRQVAPPFVLGCGLLTLYLATMPPGLTWANDGADGGDLIASATTGGVAHPTGYPVYLLSASLFQTVPVGELAFRTGLLSACAAVGAALLLFAVIRRALGGATLAGGVEALFGGLAAALALGLSPLIWSQAVITEVYTLNLFFIALLIYLLSLPAARSRLRNGLTGIVQGLAVGNHVLAALIIPATLIILANKRLAAPGTATRNWSWDLGALRDGSLGLVVGLSSYAILPVRASFHPAVNWGDASSLRGFWWLVSGSLYQPELLQFQVATIWLRLQAWAGLTFQQFGFLGVAMALLGLVVFFKRSRLYFLTIWLALVYSVFAVQYDVIDWRVYLLPVYLAFSVWIGVAVGECALWLNQRWARADWILGGVCIIYFGVLGLQAWPQVDASRDNSAEAYGRAVMSKAPANALLFAQGDQAVFDLWYFHYALHERPDLAVVATELLPFQWYRENLRHTYTDLVLPVSSQMPWLQAVRAANPGRQACYLYSLDTLLNC